MMFLKYQMASLKFDKQLLRAGLFELRQLTFYPQADSIQLVFYFRYTDNVLVSYLLLSIVYCSQLAVIALASLCDNVMYFWRKYIFDRYLYRRP
uniref:Uncharacterized protein n=1 Tax=Siphoviridae sp. ctC6Q17 TaxID=2827271 RepID=A0A8S5R2X4_9CAUD|nr:MAG TPA: hypothetical protein [Siphoviridae sp. ctC6Q17]